MSGIIIMITEFSIEEEKKGNFFKKIWKKYNSIDYFSRVSLTICILILLITPFILLNRLELRSRGAGNTLGVGAGEYPTIGAALAAASTGDTISVHAGTYNEQVEVTKSVTLQAFGDGEVWIDGQNNLNNGIRITASNVTIDNLEVKQVRAQGVYIDGNSGGRHSNITLQNMTIQDFDSDGNTTAIENEAGIAAWYSGSNIRILNNQIIRRSTGSLSQGKSDGIWFKSNSANPSGGGHVISGNTIKGTWDGIGGETEDDIHGTFDKDTLIENNTIDTCWDDGIQVEGGSENVIIRHNTIVRCALGIASAPNLKGPLYIEYNRITDGVVGDFNNLACFKVGDQGTGKTFYTGNTCILTAGVADGWSQTNSGMNAVEVRNNKIHANYYVVEFTGFTNQTQADTTSFDSNCFYNGTVDPGHYIKWNGQAMSYSSWKSSTGFEVNGINTQNCPDTADLDGNPAGVIIGSSAPTITPGGPTLTPIPTATPTRTPTPSPTPIPGAVIIDFSSRSAGALNGEYPTGVANWGTSVWNVGGPYLLLQSNHIYLNGTLTSGAVTPIIPSKLDSILAFNESGATGTVTLSCTGNPNVTQNMNANTLVTITTNWTANCQGPITIASSRGGSINFDDLRISPQIGPTIAPSLTPTFTPSPIPTNIPTSTPTPFTQTTGTGLQGYYYDNSNFTGLITTRIDPRINFNWGQNSPAAGIGSNTFSVQWTGFIKPPTTGIYTFYANSDDGVRIWVNNQQIINRWTDQSTRETRGTISFTAGVKYPIKVEYYENSGKAQVELRWSGPSVSKQIIPTANSFAN